MSSRIVIEIPSSERWTEMKGYLRQWNLKLPPKFVVQDANRREVRDTIERAQRIVLTHECSEEFTQMLNTIAMDLPKGRVALHAPVKTTARTQRTRPERKPLTSRQKLLVTLFIFGVLAFSFLLSVLPPRISLAIQGVFVTWCSAIVINSLWLRRRRNDDRPTS